MGHQYHFEGQKEEFESLGYPPEVKVAEIWDNQR
jgi:hypothetical protein